LKVAREITYVQKTERSDPHARIQKIGGEGWTMTEDAAILQIETGWETFYVYPSDAPMTKVIVATHEGHKYLKTEADDLQPNNLLALPERR
jgi:hypothetical protein